MKHPIQPIVKDERGVMRFKANAIVQHLLDTHPSCDMNLIARMNFTAEDRHQFDQLMGYSLHGYGELQSHVDDEAYAAAKLVAEGADHRDAVIGALEQKLAEIRNAIDVLREPMASLFEKHPDDFKR